MRSVCRYWAVSNSCAFGDRCHFAHSYPATSPGLTDFPPLSAAAAAPQPPPAAAAAALPTFTPRPVAAAPRKAAVYKEPAGIRSLGSLFVDRALGEELQRRAAAAHYYPGEDSPRVRGLPALLHGQYINVVRGDPLPRLGSLSLQSFTATAVHSAAPVFLVQIEDVKDVPLGGKHVCLPSLIRPPRNEFMLDDWGGERRWWATGGTSSTPM